MRPGGEIAGPGPFRLFTDLDVTFLPGELIQFGDRQSGPLPILLDKNIAYGKVYGFELGIFDLRAGDTQFAELGASKAEPVRRFLLAKAEDVPPQSAQGVCDVGEVAVRVTMTNASIPSRRAISIASIESRMSALFFPGPEKTGLKLGADDQSCVVFASP